MWAGISLHSRLRLSTKETLSRMSAEDWRIEDTSGKDIEDHRKVREIIGGKVERLLRALGSEQAGNAAEEGVHRGAT